MSLLMVYIKNFNMGYIADFVYTFCFGLFLFTYHKIMTSRVVHIIIGLFCILQLFIGFYIPLSIASVLFIGSGSGGLFGLWRLHNE